MRVGMTLLALAVGPVFSLHLDGIKELISNYDNIFPHGNRNAASHRWATFVLENAQDHTLAEIETLFQGFCPVSGSPVTPGDYNRWEILLSAMSGDVYKGATHHCCWPCLCDLHDFVRVDTKTVKAKDGSKKMNFLVIGDPCLHAYKLTTPYKNAFDGTLTTIADGAPDVTCGSDNTLEKATYSDNGGVIIGLLLDSKQASLNEAEEAYKGWAKAMAQRGGLRGPEAEPQENSMRAMAGQCAKRARSGYNSGMGAIFRQVAKINPLKMQQSGGAGQVDCPAPSEHGSECGSQADCVNLLACQGLDLDVDVDSGPGQ